jgi:hypothetical protein
LSIRGTGLIDCVITSPPYLTAVNYYRRHQLEMFWLGLTHTTAERLELMPRYLGRDRVARHHVEDRYFSHALIGLVSCLATAMTISFGRSDVRCKGSPPPRWGRVGWGWSCRGITAETKGIRSPVAPLCTKKKILYLRSRARQRAEVYGARMPAATTFERASPPPNPPPSMGRALLCRDMQAFLRDTTLGA